MVFSGCCLYFQPCRPRALRMAEVWQRKRGGEEMQSGVPVTHLHMFTRGCAQAGMHGDQLHHMGGGPELHGLTPEQLAAEHAAVQQQLVQQAHHEHADPAAHYVQQVLLPHLLLHLSIFCPPTLAVLAHLMPVMPSTRGSPIRHAMLTGWSAGWRQEQVHAPDVEYTCSVF